MVGGDEKRSRVVQEGWDNETSRLYTPRGEVESSGRNYSVKALGRVSVLRWRQAARPSDARLPAAASRSRFNPETDEAAA